MANLSKRQFLRSIVGTAALSTWAGLDETLAKVASVPPVALAQEEDFWASIRAAYPVTKDFIQLENGYYSLAAQPVMDSYLKHIQQINSVSSYYMRTRQVDDKRESQTQLAKLVGCSPDELIITRNTTESLDTVIGGLTWKAGDEAIMVQQDYGAMQDMFKLQARRHGIVNRTLSLPNHPKSDAEIVSLYEKAITPKTRLLMVCHMVNITGQILPIRQITEMAHKHGVEVLVDGAHAFAQLNYKLADLGGCDYYASSLHKWLGTPLGAGMLYVRKDKIAGIWPMFADSSVADTDIRKLNHTGTHPVATDLAIQDAIKFHERIGIERKEARLRYLQRYWTDQVRHNPKIILNTPEDPARSCAIANVGVAGKTPAELAKILFDNYKIFTVAIDSPPVQGVRVTPHVYTTTAELDAFVKALNELAG
ncbi:aminotransferase class V-fold PLP-dependent enzyme [Spirosoma utsteinense]|uniref:Selenocysteine lyase/cysteine desulfurase n=1 Tax=Spirosoma utsteinense TaxID=2585773 RepID=A0ABR6WAG6_9BACT|nr:aminotransferase class V-fold PLP-dependent enzyme [Spirosoma utsteinense]MBC3783860.1 selenocysteine lyase/cysteine desulfurase [Spirosoma utsteinense]MBC3793561.1 selenocysteine lyase/cysteine desulfurase [Spirosoma utsteinense]